MTDLLEPLLKSPVLPDLVARAQSVLEKETQAREKFLKELTPEMKAEFISGKILMHSPAKAKHLDITARLFARLYLHCEQTNNGRAFVEKCLVSLTRNDFEPDIVWFSQEKAEQFQPDQMRFPAPDFIVEVLSNSTEERDRGVKFIDYALHGVTEYWIIDPEQKTIERYLLAEGADEYTLAEKLAHGTAASQVIHGFEISWQDLF